MFSIKRSLFSVSAILMAGIFLAGCGNGGSMRTITAEVEGVSGEADAACLYIDVIGNQANSPLVTTEVKGDRFTLELPETVDTKLLRPVSSIIGGGDGATISDLSAKACEATIEGLKDGSIAGRFCYERDDNALYAETYIFYVDKDVDITGTNEDGTKYSCNLKKGWNFVADIMHMQGNDPNEMTTILPEGLMWDFY
ncbi:MAG: hypothetical protein LBV41_06315 [Cytophagaceae bacterium]|jgi:hypothetical protein|nr:hypothetical protein [Cytophagaceae bacterium]